jgi:hypothetical protein
VQQLLRLRGPASNDLERNRAPELWIPRFVDDAARAFADGPSDLVARDARAGRQEGRRHAGGVGKIVVLRVGFTRQGEVGTACLVIRLVEIELRCLGDQLAAYRTLRDVGVQPLAFALLQGAAKEAENLLFAQTLAGDWRIDQGAAFPVSLSTARLRGK